nr:hypothetical protein [Tanacetum cinerariifolium]
MANNLVLKIYKIANSPRQQDEPASPQRDGRRIDEGEAATERISDDTEEMATVLTSMDAATVLASGVVDIPTSSRSIPTASTLVEEQVPTGNDVVPTASPKISKEEFAWLKRKGIRHEQEEVKKMKTSKEVPEEVKSYKEVSEEKIKEMIQLVPIEEVYVKALQVKHPIIDWKVHTKGQRAYWKITKLGGSSAMKETLSNRPLSSDKEMKLWVELSRFYEPDNEDQLWTHTQNLMHAPVEWRLYDTCGVHHVTSKDKEIFMLVETDYPLRKGLALVMISYKLQVENYSQMANDLVLKIYKIANSPRQQGISTASYKSFHWHDNFPLPVKKVATARRKTGKKISIQGSDVLGFDKSKVECFNCHKMGHFAREFKAPRSQERGRKDNYRQSKIKDLTDELFEANNYIYHYKLAVVQLKGRLVEYKKREVKYIEKIRTLEMYRESNLKCIETLGKELETLKLEKDGLDGKLAGLLKASKNLDNLIESQRSDKVKDGVGYNDVPPPPADLYLSPKKYLSWTGLPEFVDDTVIDYSRPMPTIKSTSEEDQNKNSSTSEDVASPISPKPFVKFMKPKDTQSEKNKKETPKKSQVK